MAAPNSPWSMLGFCVTTLVTAVGLIGSYVTIVLAPQIQAIKDLKDDSRDIRLTMAPLLTLYAQHKSDEDRFLSFQTQIDKKLDSNIHDLFATSTNDRLNTLVITDDKSRDEILHQVHDLENKIVSREENTIHWRTVDALVLRVNALAEKCGVK
jgi:hypothetical protein